MDTIGNWVPVGSKQDPCVCSEVGSSLVCAEVDGQLGWRTPLQSGSLHIWAHSPSSSEGPGLEGLHHIVHFRVDCVFGMSDRNFLHFLHECTR
jgi:hypothetical protein